MYPAVTAVFRFVERRGVVERDPVRIEIHIVGIDGGTGNLNSRRVLERDDDQADDFIERNIGIGLVVEVQLH